MLGQSVSLLEWIAFATGLLSVWLTQRMHVANWPVGLINVICFAVLFLDAKLYANALLQVAFFVLGVYGWWSWVSVKRVGEMQRVTRSSRPEYGWLSFVAVSATACTSGALAALTDSPAPIPDAAILVLSLIATWLQAKRRLECWMVWITVDLISIPLYWSQALHLTSMLYLVFLAICMAGLASWRQRARTLAT